MRYTVKRKIVILVTMVISLVMGIAIAGCKKKQPHKPAAIRTKSASEGKTSTQTPAKPTASKPVVRQQEKATPPPTHTPSPDDANNTSATRKPDLSGLPLNKLPDKVKKNFLNTVKADVSLAIGFKKSTMGQPLFVLVLRNDKKIRVINKLFDQISDRNMKHILEKITKLLHKWSGLQQGKLSILLQSGTDFQTALLALDKPSHVPSDFSVVMIPKGTVLELKGSQIPDLGKNDQTLLPVILDWYAQTRYGLSMTYPLLLSVDKNMSFRLFGPLHPENTGMKRLSMCFQLTANDLNLPKVIPAHIRGLSTKEVKSLRRWLLQWGKDNLIRRLAQANGPQPSFIRKEKTNPAKKSPKKSSVKPAKAR